MSANAITDPKTLAAACRDAEIATVKAGLDGEGTVIKSMRRRCLQDLREPGRSVSGNAVAGFFLGALGGSTFTVAMAAAGVVGAAVPAMGVGMAIGGAALAGAASSLWGMISKKVVSRRDKALEWARQQAGYNAPALRELNACAQWRNGIQAAATANIEQSVNTLSNDMVKTVQKTHRHDPTRPAKRHRDTPAPAP